MRSNAASVEMLFPSWRLLGCAPHEFMVDELARTARHSAQYERWVRNCKKQFRTCGDTVFVMDDVHTLGCVSPELMDWHGTCSSQ